nr:hypothetical protein [Tanacetum cinerariifolium]
ESRFTFSNRMPVHILLRNSMLSLEDGMLGPAIASADVSLLDGVDRRLQIWTYRMPVHILLRNSMLSLEDGMLG